MSVLEHLITADRIVLAGLTAYDRAMASAWDKCTAAMRAEGVPDEQIALAEEDHRERARIGRDKLHREVWTKALAHLADYVPTTATAPER